MILSDISIQKAVENGLILILPEFRLEHLRPTGIRVHLSNKVLVPLPGQIIDLAESTEVDYQTIDLGVSGYALEPGHFLLAKTYEHIKTEKNIVCCLDGRSTFARLGLSIHNTASIIDGTIIEPMAPVLEIVNQGNLTLILKPYVPIGMVYFQYLKEETSGKTFHNQYLQENNLIAPNLKMRPVSL